MPDTIPQTPEEIRAQVEARIREEVPEDLPEPVQGQSAAPELSGKFIRDCLNSNERGDGVLYATLHRGKFVCNLKERDATKDRGIWYLYNGVHWELDKRHLANNAVEDVARLYLREAERLRGLMDDLYEQLQAANKEVSRANKLAKEAEKNKDLAKKIEADELGTRSEAEAARLKGEYGALRAEWKEYNSRIDRLRSCPGIEKTLTMAHRIGPVDSLSIIGNEFDQKPLLLPCKNGVIDLRTGKLHPGKPDDYLLRAVPFEYTYDPHYLATGENSPCPKWDKFFDEIHLGKDSVAGFVKRLLGYGITGLTTEHFIGVFKGAGRNGKGTMFELIKNILGELAWAINPEMILDQKNSRGTAGPSADLVSLYGRRFVIASETDEGKKISSSMVKRLTGGDTLTVRAPFDKYEWGYTPTHTLFLYTNDVPYGLTKDFALRQRLVLVDYPLRYVDNPEYEAGKDPSNAHLYRLKDKDLPADLRGESPGILMWLVRACLLWQQLGLAPPEDILAATQDLYFQEDTIGQYLAECIDINSDGSGKASFKSLYNHYLQWWEEYHGGGKSKPFGKKSFGDYLQKRGMVPVHSNGRHYLGLSISDPYRFTATE